MKYLAKFSPFSNWDYRKGSFFVWNSHVQGSFSLWKFIVTVLKIFVSKVLWKYYFRNKMMKNESSCYKLEKYEKMIFVTLSNAFFFLQREKNK